MSRLHRLSCVIAFLLLAAAGSLRADVTLPAIFGDHMVLQEGMKLPVWGTAGPGESVTVTVTVGTATAKTTAGPDGKWRVDLAALPTQAEPVTMTVTGTNTLTFHDVLVGEVWLCTGQSNMELPMQAMDDAATSIPAANDPQIRLFLVAKTTSRVPLDDVKGTWQLCTPDTVKGFSAVGYNFARDLRAKLNRPVGLIGSYWGGTPAQAWTSLEALKAVPALQSYVAEYQKNQEEYPARLAQMPAAQAAYLAKLKAWRESVGKVQKSASGAPIARTKPPLPPPGPDGGQREPTNNYNGMIAPLIPFAIKGAIWYQGEANAGVLSIARQYRTLFGAMITDWRRRWGEGPFPFLFVQLAAYQNRGTWPYLRESQAETLALPDTGMATAIDVGNPGYIHPGNKAVVAGRLALLARHLAYGEKDLLDQGPTYQSIAISGSSATVSFTNVGGGLIIGSAPWVAKGYPPIPTDKLYGFTIAGGDKKWVPADAKIVGNQVVVSSPQVPTPAAVRYDWDNSPQGNLYNQEQLPAFPFRTDDWDDDPAAKGQIAVPAPAPPN
jgi:sialate O-acetylesterase